MWALPAEMRAEWQRLRERTAAIDCERADEEKQCESQVFAFRRHHSLNQPR